MRTARLVCALTVFMTLAAACGDPSDKTTSSTPPPAAGDSATLDPCALVTKAEADEALGAESKPDRPSEANIPPGLVTCRYTAPRGQGLAVMTVMVRTGYSVAEAKAGFDGTRAVGQTQAVSGLGDDAFWLLDQLYVLRGTRQLTLSGDVTKETAEALARKALERLR